MEEKNSRCPLCSGDTSKVKAVTLRHFLVDDLVNMVDEDSYKICLSEDCDAVYSSLDDGRVFRKKDMKIPIWYKKGADPKYICYCNHVSEEQIINAVVSDGARDMKDIIRLTGAMKNGRCETNNPLGRCCGSLIEETIQKALENL